MKYDFGQIWNTKSNNCIMFLLIFLNGVNLGMFFSIMQLTPNFLYSFFNQLSNLQITVTSISFVLLIASKVKNKLREEPPWPPSISMQSIFVFLKIFTWIYCFMKFISSTQFSLLYLLILKTSYLSASMIIYIDFLYNNFLLSSDFIVALIFDWIKNIMVADFKQLKFKI